MVTGTGVKSTRGLRPSSRSTQGARSKTSFSFSSPYDRSMMSQPAFRTIGQVLRVKVSSPAKKVKSTFSRCSGRTLWMKVGSSPTASSWPSDSSSSSRRMSVAGKLRSLRTSFNSRPFRVPAPTIATRNIAPQCRPPGKTPAVRFGSFSSSVRGLVLRWRRRHGGPPEYERKPGQHPGEDIHQRQQEEHILGRKPHQRNDCAHHDKPAEILRLAKVDPLQAKEPPGAHHEESDSEDENAPSDGKP